MDTNTFVFLFLHFDFISMDLIGLVFFFIIIVPSAIIHEYAHGWMADMLGDPTARLEGRLTLNPRAHIDPFGTILMPVLLFLISNGTFLFAYAKPVPYNPYNLNNLKWGPALVGIAGPVSNILVAFVFGLMVRFAPTLGLTSFAGFVDILSIIVYANVLLAVFNMVPIPPLDGSKVLFSLLPDSMNAFKMFLERYGLILLLLFIFVAFQLISPIIWRLFELFTGMSFLPF